MSLANYFDVKEPQDFLRGLLNALAEFDQSKEEGERPKMVSLLITRYRQAVNRNLKRSLFRSGRPKRQLGATDYAISYTDSLETSYLVMPHVVGFILQHYPPLFDVFVSAFSS
jgi:hypothetical protein